MEKSQNEKTVLICTGGGMKLAYQAGSLYAIAKKYKSFTPDVAIGISGGSANLAYFITEQHEESKHIWTNLLSTYKFISLIRFWKIINIDYIIDSIFKNLEPLDTNVLQSSNTEFYIAATNFYTGKAEYLNPSNGINVFEALRASSAIPVLYNRRVSINGNKYIDGTFGVDEDKDIYSKYDKKDTTILLLESGNSRINRLGAMVMGIYVRFINDNLRKTIEKYIRNKRLDGSKFIHASVILIQPNKKLSTLRFTGNKRNRLMLDFELGYNETTSNKQLNEFFNIK